MAVSEALRATRLGSLKYDKNWLESGKTTDILALCNQFDRTLTLTTEDQRVIATSPKSAITTKSSGLGGGTVDITGSTSAARDGQSSVSSKTVETPSSATSSTAESAKTDTTLDDKRDESLTGYELAVLRYETEFDQRLKAAVDNRLTLLRRKWGEYEKKLASPPDSPRSLSPDVPEENIAKSEAVENVGEYHQAVSVESPVEEYDYQRDDITPPPPEELPANQQYGNVEPDVEEERPISPPSPLVEEPVEESEVIITSEEVIVDNRDEVDHQVGFRESTTDLQGAVTETETERPKELLPENPPAVTFSFLRPADRQVPERTVPETPAIPAASRPADTSNVAASTEPLQVGQSQPPASSQETPSERTAPAGAPAAATTEVDPALARIRISQVDVARFSSAARLNEYKLTVAEYQRQKESCEQVQERLASGFGSRNADRVTKGIRQELSNLITTTINLISKENLTELSTRFDQPSRPIDPLTRLGQLLNGDTIEFQQKRVSIKKHPDAPEFACDLIARTLVKQAENVASVQRDMAYPLAIVAVGLWVKFPRVGDFVKAVVKSRCPYLVPFIPPRDSSDSDQDYLVKLGYQRDKSGEVEKQPLFLKRMIGICRFWTAIMCVPAVPWNQLPRPTTARRLNVKSTVPHPLDFHIGWAFLVNLLQLMPRPDITAVILLEFLELSSHFLKKVYGRQYEKLLRFVTAHCMPEISDASTAAKAGSASYTRLKTFLDSGPKRFEMPEDYPRSWLR